MTGIADYLPCMPFTEKFLRVPGDIEVTGRHVKRYHVNTIDDEIPGAIQEAAYAFLPRLLPEPDGETPPAGWVVLHKGAGTAAYLCSYSWVWELPPLGHERSAWVRHVLAPAEPDLGGYLADTLPEGKTGGEQ